MPHLNAHRMSQLTSRLKPVATMVWNSFPEATQPPAPLARTPDADPARLSGRASAPLT